MNLVNRLLLTPLICLCTTVVWAQNEEDVLRFSQAYSSGTARSQAIGGAAGAVGADFSSTAINPAGLGLYRRNEVHLSSAIAYATANSTFIGSASNEGRTHFHLPSFGVVFTRVFNEMGKDVTKGLASVSIAAGMNRIQSFQSNQYFSGVNNSNSIADAIATAANGIPYTAFGPPGSSNSPVDLAWQLLIIDTMAGQTDRYYNRYAAGSNQPSFRQSQRTTIRGGMNEYNISAGINLSHIVYIGGGLLINHAYRNSEVMFNETILDPSISPTRNLSYKQSIDASGLGFAGRFGVILRPVDFLRLGISAQTASRIKMREDYQSEMTVSYINAVNTGPANYIEYDIVTPAKFTASMMLMNRSIGFISADVEYVDFSSPYISSAFDYTKENTAIRTNFTNAINYRIGGEIRVQQIFRLRGGYNFMPSPYKSSVANHNQFSQQIVTAGAGLIVDRFFYDLSIASRIFKTVDTPYRITNAVNNSAVTDFNTYTFAITAGYRF